jgi:hypothetical protein
MSSGAIRWLAMLGLTALFTLCGNLESHGQSGGGTGGGSGGSDGGGTGGGVGTGGGATGGSTGSSRGKNFDGTLKTPDKPGLSQQQRDRIQRLEEKLRQGEGEAPATTPQTQMSDRLEKLHKNASPGQLDLGDTGR